MTCIVGLEHEGDVYIGGDSAGVYESNFGLMVRADEKVFVRERRNERWVFGFCGSFRVGQLLRYKLALPEPEDDDDLYQFMVTKFVDAVRITLDEGGALMTKSGVETAETFLVGLRGQLWIVEDDMQVGRAVDPFMAIGCGDHLAAGAMHATQNFDVGPNDRVLAALSAAERFSAGVRAPFCVVSTELDSKKVSRKR